MPTRLPFAGGLALQLFTIVVVFVFLAAGVLGSGKPSKRDMLEMQITTLHAHSPVWSSPSSSSPRCSHGYISSADRSTCVCNTGWTGPDCSRDALPSCVRGRGEPCFGDLRFTGTAETQSCECLAECVSYVRDARREVFGDRG